MILYDFIYEWDGKSHDGTKPIAWWPGAYHVKIISLGSDEPDIAYLVPTAVVLKNAKIKPNMDTSLKNYLHTFAQKICSTYNLDIEKTLWVEIDGTIRVTRLRPDPRKVPESMHDIVWRDIRPNELDMIQPYISDLL